MLHIGVPKEGGVRTLGDGVYGRSEEGVSQGHFGNEVSSGFLHGLLLSGL